MTEPSHITTTVVFADICRSTWLFNQLGDDRAAALVGELLKTASSVVAAQHGIVLRSKGDDVLCIFSDPLDALQASMDIHAALNRFPPVGNVDCAMKIGINSGPVLLSEGDLLGGTVNIAARLSGVAKAGQTVVSRHTIDRLDLLPEGLLLRPLGDISLKGKSGPVPVFELLDASRQDEITQVGRVAIQLPRSNRLSIRFQSLHSNLDYLLVRFLLGRGPECDLVLDHPLVSRQHAEIRYRSNEFVLIDFSTNGSELITGGQTRSLRHSQAALRGQGSIFLGGTSYNRQFEIAFHASGGLRGIHP